MPGTGKLKRQIEQVVKEHVEDYEISHTRNGHLRVTVTGSLGSRSTIVASSASDHRAFLNFRANLFRLLAEVGLERKK